jgi:hypothetical protein
LKIVIICQFSLSLSTAAMVFGLVTHSGIIFTLGLTVFIASAICIKQTTT